MCTPLIHFINHAIEYKVGNQCIIPILDVYIPMVNGVTMLGI